MEIIEAQTRPREHLRWKALQQYLTVLLIALFVGLPTTPPQKV